MRITTPYHLVNPSPWPLCSGISAGIMAIGLITKFNNIAGSTLVLSLGLSLVGLTAILWWKDIVIEGSLQGFHTLKVKEGLKIGVILFFISESALFASLFWAYFHASLSPNIEIGSIWPPEGIIVLDPWETPILNIVVLLTSAASCTYAHEKLLAGAEKEARIGLGLTVVLGALFLVFQYSEFIAAPFSIADSVYGSSFFIITTAHMGHVIVGAIFLSVCLIRIPHFTKTHHLGLEAAIWYWHIIDLVYLLVFIVVYYWGSQI